MAELTPYKPGRSQMGIDLLKAINEPSFTAQDLARQEEQERVEKFGGIRMPTQMENVWKGMEMATGIQPFGDQSKLDRAMMAAEMIAPGIKGKAMMPAMVPALGAIMRPGKWYKGWKDSEKFGFDQHISHEPYSVHSMGPHFAKESDVAQGFAKHDYYIPSGFTGLKLPNPKRGEKSGGVMSQVELKGKGRRIPTKVESGDYIDDYEAVGRDVANFVFNDPKVGKASFWDYMKNSGWGKVGKKSEADSIWERLKAFKGGFVGQDGSLHGKTHLIDKLKPVDNEIKKVKAWTFDKHPASLTRYNFMTGVDYPLTKEEFRVKRVKSLKALRKQKDNIKKVWQHRYVRDFGEYLKKSKQADRSFDSMSRRDYTDFYKAKLAEDGVTHVIYKNTNPDEYLDLNKRIPTKGGGTKARVMNRDTAMVLDMDAIKESWGK